MKVDLTVFDLSGERVFGVSFEGNRGTNSLPWNLENQWGGQVASGLYIYEIEANDGNSVITQKGKVAVLH